MITLASISQGKLGLSAEERVELERLREREAKHTAELVMVKAEAAATIGQLEEDIMELVDRVHRAQGAQPWNSDNMYTNNIINTYNEYTTKDNWTYTKNEDY